MAIGGGRALAQVVELAKRHRGAPVGIALEGRGLRGAKRASLQRE